MYVNTRNLPSRVDPLTVFVIELVEMTDMGHPRTLSVVGVCRTLDDAKTRCRDTAEILADSPDLIVEESCGFCNPRFVVSYESRDQGRLALKVSEFGVMEVGK